MSEGPRSRDVFPGVFDRHAGAYRDRLANAVERGEARGRARVVELLSPAPGERVVDLGCGPGVLAVPLAHAVGETGLVVAVDLAVRMLALTRAAAPQASVARMDMERLGLADGFFDAAACGHALQFCPDLDLALSEARRVLRPGGRFAASLPASGAPGLAARLLDEVFERLPRAPEPADASDTRQTVRDPDRLEAALAAAGFREVGLERVEERAAYAGPAHLVDTTLRWWSCAWRLEGVPEATRESIRAEAVAVLAARLGTGPLELEGATWVLAGRA